MYAALRIIFGNISHGRVAATVDLAKAEPGGALPVTAKEEWMLDVASRLKRQADDGTEIRYGGFSDESPTVVEALFLHDRLSENEPYRGLMEEIAAASFAAGLDASPETRAKFNRA